MTEGISIIKAILKVVYKCELLLKAINNSIMKRK
jgi:hypothetical protein